MIPNDPEERRTIIRYMLKRFVDDDGYYLSDWEYNFVISIHEQFQEKGDLLDRQYKILENLYDRCRGLR